MRNDFTSGFISGKNKNVHQPVLLLKLEWAARPSTSALTLRFADRALTTGAEAWQAQVLRWQGAGPDTLKAVILWNGPSNLAPGATRFSDLFAQYPPELAMVTLYQWFEGEGLDESDLAPLFAGVIADPVQYDASECRLPLTPFSESLGRKGLGTPVTLSDYPNVPLQNLGKTRPIVIGAVSQVPGIRVRNVKRTRLTSVALPGSSTLDVASTEDFPNTSTLVLNDDEIIYTGKTVNQFTGCSGIAEFHFADDEVLEKVSDHRFLFSDPVFPIQSISRVCVGGHPVDPADYTLDVVKGEVIFSSQPREVRSVDTKFLQAQFDEVAGGNTAVDASFAMQPNLRSRYARINQASRKLNLRQADVMAPLGQIGRVLLRVEHFMEERLSSDSIAVRLSGVGEVGTLSPPADDDSAVTTGSTDITHNHLDTFGFPIDIPQPSIAPTSNADHVVEQGAVSGTGKYQNLIAGLTFVTITFPSAPTGATHGEYQLNLNVEGGLFGIGEAALFFHGNKVAKWNPARANFDYTSSFTLNGSAQPGTMTLSVGAQGGQWTVSLTSVKRLLFYPHGTQATQQSQQTLKSGATTQASLQPSLSAVTEKPTRTVVDFFDVTSAVNADWSWFSGREVEVEYLGSSDGRTVYVLHTAFEIEYARRRLKSSGDITADVSGVIDDPAGSVSGVPNSLLERPDHLFLWSLKNILLLPDASIDSASFASTGSLLLGAVPGGYRLSGVVQQRQTLAELWQAWMVSSRSRLLWSPAGRSRLLFHPLNTSAGLEGQEVKTLSDATVLLHPASNHPRVKLIRGKTNALSTALNLPYERDWSATVRRDRYRKLLRVQDTVQSELFGNVEPPGGRPLDWCAVPAMAEDLAGFYLAELSRPPTLLECDVALAHLDLEWGDIVKLDHPDTGLNGVFARLTGRTDLAGEETPDGLQAVRLQFHLFPIEFLQETAQEEVAGDEILTLFLNWQTGGNNPVSAQELAGFWDQPADVTEPVQAMEDWLFQSSLLTGESSEVAEVLLHHLNLAEALDRAGAGEAAFSSAEGGWGNQAWGFTGWGGREVLM